MLKVYRLRRIISATLWFGALSCQSQQVTDHLERRTALQSSVTDSETTPLAVGNLGNGLGTVDPDLSTRHFDCR